MRFSILVKTISVLLPSLFLAACSGDGKTTTSGGNADSLSDFANSLNEALCANAVECHRAETNAECLATQQTEIPEYQKYVDDGTIKFHPENTDACIAAFSVLGSCSLTEVFAQGGIDILETACAPTLEGTLAEGTACAIDEQCVSGNCDLVDPNCADACCANKCMAKEIPPVLPKIGEPCPDFDCEKGAYCQSDTMGMPTTCAATVGAGKPCTSFGQCELPATCDLDFTTMMGTCKAPIAHGAACNPMGISLCDRTDDYCDPTTKVCTTKPLPGSACVNDSCVDYAYCDQATTMCVKDLPAGAACTDMTDCLGELSCEMGKCAFDTPVVCP
ncbi:MAG TPA: hypothetical protein PK156_29485 [Polyangium sp.]|nr:hypothetical protein [Polyangium sp.]